VLIYRILVNFYRFWTIFIDFRSFLSILGHFGSFWVIRRSLLVIFSDFNQKTYMICRVFLEFIDFFKNHIESPYLFRHKTPILSIFRLKNMLHICRRIDPDFFQSNTPPFTLFFRRVLWLVFLLNAF
jgi:hypothetical protein